MPTTVNIVTGAHSATLTAGLHFEFVNPTATAVQLSACSGFCVNDSYSVPATANGVPGTAAAQINSNPQTWTFTETPSVWNPGGPIPGMPHIQNPPMPREERGEEEREEKEVA